MVARTEEMNLAARIAIDARSPSNTDRPYCRPPLATGTGNALRADGRRVPVAVSHAAHARDRGRARDEAGASGSPVGRQGCFVKRSGACASSSLHRSLQKQQAPRCWRCQRHHQQHHIGRDRRADHRAAARRLRARPVGSPETRSNAGTPETLGDRAATAAAAANRWRRRRTDSAAGARGPARCCPSPRSSRWPESRPASPVPAPSSAASRRRRNNRAGARRCQRRGSPMAGRNPSCGAPDVSQRSPRERIGLRDPHLVLADVGGDRLAGSISAAIVAIGAVGGADRRAGLGQRELTAQRAGRASQSAPPARRTASSARRRRRPRSPVQAQLLPSSRRSASIWMTCAFGAKRSRRPVARSSKRAPIAISRSHSSSTRLV